jgi:mono/diheme cytochrome c family protein
MESGFPHGADSWLSSAGTSWAVLAMASALAPSQTSPAQPALASASNAVGRPVGASAPTGAPSVTAADADKTPAPVDFSKDIQPLLERSCVACHSGERAKGGLQMVDRASLLHGGKRGEPVVVASHSDQSPLIRFVSDEVEDLEMPPLGKREKFPPLTKEEVVRLRAWIDQGAGWPKGTTLQASRK